MLGTLTPASSSPCQGQTQSTPRGESESGHVRVHQSMCVEVENNLWLISHNKSCPCFKWCSRPFNWLPKLFPASSYQKLPSPKLVLTAKIGPPDHNDA